MAKPLAMFRTDASVSGGLGHVMRCRALAREWLAHGGRVTFVTTETPSDLLECVRRDGCDVRLGPSGLRASEEMAWLLSLLKEECPAVLIADGYGFDVDYQRRIRPWVRCLVCLDDLPGRPFECDVVLNQNLGVARRDYELLVSSGTTVLLGPRYALLREGFREHSGIYRVRARRSKVLVTLGGSDQQNYTARVLADLAGLPDLEIDVVLGPMYGHGNPLEGIKVLHPDRVRVHQGLDGLLDLARQVDLAVTAAGSTVWELACLGIPMVVIGTAENQEAVLRGLRSEKAALVLGHLESLVSGDIAKEISSLLADPSRLQGFSQTASRLVDGRGVQRVVEVVETICARSVSRAGMPAGAVRP